jgi:hypothetical protein
MLRTNISEFNISESKIIYTLVVTMFQIFSNLNYPFSEKFQESR